MKTKPRTDSSPKADLRIDTSLNSSKKDVEILRDGMTEAQRNQFETKVNGLRFAHQHMMPLLTHA